MHLYIFPLSLFPSFLAVFCKRQLGGAIVFVISLITLIDRNFLSELLGTNLFSGAVYVLVITSALVCLLAFFGCFGAVKEIKCMLLTVSTTFFACDCARHMVIISGDCLIYYSHPIDVHASEGMQFCIPTHTQQREVKEENSIVFCARVFYSLAVSVAR
jgi:hypothetical protein